MRRQACAAGSVKALHAVSECVIVRGARLCVCSKLKDRMVAGKHILSLVLLEKAGPDCMFGGISRVRWQQACSASVSKGTIGWLVLYVDSLSGSVDTAFDGKRVVSSRMSYTSPCAHCRG